VNWEGKWTRSWRAINPNAAGAASPDLFQLFSEETGDGLRLRHRGRTRPATTPTSVGKNQLTRTSCPNRTPPAAVVGFQKTPGGGSDGFRGQKSAAEPASPKDAPRLGRASTLTQNAAAGLALSFTGDGDHGRRQPGELLPGQRPLRRQH